MWYDANSIATWFSYWDHILDIGDVPFINDWNPNYVVQSIWQFHTRAEITVSPGNVWWWQEFANQISYNKRKEFHIS